MSDFGRYLLRENAITYTKEKAFALLTKDELFSVNKDTRLLLSDEQFAGSPWNNAKDRKQNFDRLHELFPNANYLVVLRNQEALTQSLYLEYVKKGGTAHWKDFLSYVGNDLEFCRGAYLQFYEYYTYMVSRVGAEKVSVLYYEELQEDSTLFFKKMGHILGAELTVPAKKETKNPSIGGVYAKRLRFINRFMSSNRQPFLLFPQRYWYAIQKRLLVGKAKKKFIIPEQAVSGFCSEYKKRNVQLPNPEQLKKYGYIE